MLRSLVLLSFSIFFLNATAQEGASLDSTEGCNVFRFKYGQNKAEVMTLCQDEGVFEPIPLDPEDGEGSEIIDPDVPSEPTEDDYNAWVEFFKQHCTGGTNLKEFSEVVDRPNTWYCYYIRENTAFPPPAPTYFKSGVSFYYATGISSLTGLDYLESIPSLDLSYAQITDVKPLSNLSEIDYLTLSRTALTNLDGLEKITSLKTLTIEGAQLENINGLRNLSGDLENINLAGNKLKNIDALSNVTGVSNRLVVSSNGLENVDGLIGLKTVNELDIGRNELTNIDGLAGLENVDYRILAWYNYNLKNLDGLINLKKLNLNLWYNRGLTDVSGLQNIAEGNISATNDIRNITVKNPGDSPFCVGIINKTVTITAGLVYHNYCDERDDETDPFSPWIDFINIDCQSYYTAGSIEDVESFNNGCQNKGITELPPPEPESFNLMSLYSNSLISLSGLEFLKSVVLDLNASNNNIINIDALASLKTVGRTLNLSRNEIENADSLSNLESVTTLDLSYNQIKSMPDLTKLTNFTTINLSQNNIESTYGMPQVNNPNAIISLGYNNLTDVEGLTGLIEVSNLDLRNNSLENLDGLENLTKVKNLYLYPNPMKSINGLRNLTSGTIWFNSNMDIAPLPDETVFCQSLQAGNIIASGKSYESLCKANLNGEWVWTGKDPISRDGRTNVPSNAPYGACRAGDNFVQTPYDNLEAFSINSMSDSRSSCLENQPYPEEKGASEYAIAYATNPSLPTSMDLSSSIGICHPTNTFQCLELTGSEDRWVATNRKPSNEYDELSPEAKSAFLGSHNLGEITGTFNVNLEGRVCLNRGDRYLRKVSGEYVSYTCGGVVEQGGSTDVPDIVCDTENGIPVDGSDPVVTGNWSPQGSWYSVTQTRTIEQEMEVQCYEGKIDNVTGELLQGDYLYTETQTVETTESREYQVRKMVSHSVIPELCQPSLYSPDMICANDVYRQTGSCRFKENTHRFKFIDGIYAGTVNWTDDYNGDTVFTDQPITRYLKGTGSCDGSGPGGQPVETYPEDAITACYGVSREIIEHDNGTNRTHWEVTWNGQTLNSGTGSLNGLITIGQYTYFTEKDPVTYSTTLSNGNSGTVTEYKSCRIPYRAHNIDYRVDKWTPSSDLNRFSPEDLENMFFP